MKNETNPLSEGVLSVNSIEPGMGKKINLKILFNVLLVNNYIKIN